MRKNNFSLQSFCIFVVSLTLVFLAGCDKTKSSAPESSESFLRKKALLARVTELEKETVFLQDVRSIKKLQRTFGYYASQHRWTDVANLFSENAELQHGKVKPVTGRKDIKQFLLQLSQGDEEIRFGEMDEHMILQPVVNLSNDGLSATAHWRGFIWQGQFEQSANWLLGEYQNEYKKIDGTWVIARSIWSPQVNADYDVGWSEGNYNP